MRVITTWLLIMASGIMLAQQFPVSEIMHNGSDPERINYVILSDGYTNDQLDAYIIDATNISNDIFNKTPFKEYKKFFNVYAVKVPSNESGIDHPGTATDVNEPVIPVIDVDNYFGSAFDKYDIHRLLVPSNSADIYSVLADSYAGYDQIIVLANSTEYGGSGGVFATTSLHSSAPEIAIHEIGHSFAGLADEYWAGSQYAAEKPNMTAESDPNLIKWSDWVGENNIGINAYGSSGEPANWFRPHQSCEMRYLNQEFCSVCREGIIDRIYELVDPIDDFSPASNEVEFIGYPIEFAMNLVLPEPSTYKISWVLNGNEIARDTNSIKLTNDDLTQETNSLVATILDTTLLSKSYYPASGYEFSLSWSIENSTLPVDLLEFNATSHESFVELSWKTVNEQNIKNYIVEKSDNSVDFKPIKKISEIVNSSSIKTYSINDYNPMSGISYYRLKIIDNDGSIDYSKTKTVNRIVKFFYKIYPNPTVDNVQVSYYLNSNEEDMIIDVIDSAGKQISTNSSSGQKGDHLLSLDISKQPKGIYFIIMKNSHHTQKIKLIKM